MDSERKTLPLEYVSAQTDCVTGSSRAVRIVAAVAALVLLAIVGDFVLRSRRTLGGMSDWVLPIAAASAGSTYCALIALNILGRTVPGRVSWLRRIGGVGTPVVLIPMAIGLVKDTLADPYARTRDHVGWFAAAAILIAFSLWIGCLTIVRWRKSGPSRGHAG